jgi:hypothetical protein
MASTIAPEAGRLEVPIRQRIVWLIAGPLLILTVSCAALVGCGGGDDENALEWVFFKQLGPHKAKLVGEVGYCVGEPKPRVEKVIRRFSGRQVFLTLVLGQERPEPEECRGVGLGVFKIVTFHRNLAQLELLDSSTDPPSLRWPVE